MTMTSVGAHAATVTYTSPNSGVWDVAGYWSALPANGDTVLTGSAYTTFQQGTLDIASLTGTGQLNMSGGTLRIAGASSIGQVRLSCNCTLSGAGTLNAGSLDLTFGTLGESGHGGGTINAGRTAFESNAGLSLNINTTLNLNGGATWGASSGGTIGINSGNYGGQINIAAGTTFSDAGTLTSTQSRYLGATSQGVVDNSGTYTRSGLGTTYMQAQLTNENTGVVNVNGGVLVLGGTYGGFGGGTWNVASPATLTFSSGTSSLYGAIANNGAITLTNNASVNLSLASYSGTGSIAVNTGTLTTTSGSATMAVGSMTLGNGAARIGSTVNVGTLNMTGGFLSGGGTVTAGTLIFGSGNMGENGYGGGTTTVTGAATFDGLAQQYVLAGRTLNLNGATTWTASSAASHSGILAISGTGSKVVIGSGATFADQGTTGAGQTRNLGNDSAGTFTNQGTYTRTGLGTTVAGGAFNNDGVLNVNGGAMKIAAGGSSAGQWNVASGATLAFSGGTSDVHGGTLNNAGGTIAVTGGSVSVSGGGTSTGTISTAAGGTLNISGGSYNVNSGALTNAGTLTVSAGSLNVGSSVNFSGAGTVNVTGGQFNDSAYANLAGGTMNISGGTANLYNGATIGSLSISGGSMVQPYVSGGSLGASNVTVGSFSFTGGSMLNSQAVGLQTIVTGAATFGSGTETLSNGQQLTLNGASTWLAGNGATIAIVGGSGAQAQLNVGTGATFADLGGGNRNLGNDVSSYINNYGVYTRTGSGTTTVSNSFTNGGTLNINGGTMAFAAGIGGPQVSKGAVNIASGATMQDDGRFTFTAGTLVNQGTLQINSSTTTLAAGVAYGGNGAINVTGGALVSSIAGAITTGGIALTGGTASFVGAVNASSLALAGGTLTAAGNITVATDYTNTGFGSGNGFNKRAGVSGTGAINGANVSEAITGANVTNGTTGNATLTIGNVRVGTANSYAYQVANTGTGSTLRGAIQTTGTGVGVNDSRLTGTGVTAANFGPLAAGANSGDLAIGFTASTAGALTLNGVNTIHVANNFANVAEQNLAIVAGSGAGAYNVAAGNASVSIGNARVGTTLARGITVTNTATAGAYSEDLAASIGATSGAIGASGNLAGLVAGASNSGGLFASLDTSTAGAKSGSVTIAYATGGKVAGASNGLGTADVGSQTLALNGGVYNVAVGSVTSPVTIANQRVGGSNVGAVTVSNTAATGVYSEALNASFAGTTGGVTTTGGPVSNLAAGASDGSTMAVRVNTSTAGLKSGSVTVGYQTDGTGSNGNSGLAAIAAGSQMVAVSGKVYDTAVGSIASTPVVVASQRIGGSNVSALIVANTAGTGGYSEALNANIGGVTGAATGSGGFSDLAAGASNGSALSVGVNTASAGLKSGSVTVDYQTDGTGTNGHSGLAAIAAGSQTVDVSGAVYRLANPTTTSTITAVGRVGGVAQTTSIGIANGSPDIYTEGLTVTRGATGAGFTASGGIVNLVAGGSSNAIGVKLDTSVAGTFNGSQVLSYVSTGAGTTGAADLAIGSGSVALNGKVYATAVASTASSVVDFGIVHVGDTVSRGVAVTNAAAGALTDVLTGSANSASGPFSASGNLGGGLAAGQSSSALEVGLNTSASGVYAGTAAFNLASHDADLSDVALADLAIGLTGTVDAYADDAFAFGSGAGTLTRVGSTFYLDYGTVTQGSGALATTLRAGNRASGQADLLDGSFEFLDAADFGESGFAGFANYGAGAYGGPLTFSFDALAVGSFSDTITLHGTGHNASGYSASLGDLQLVVRGSVIGAAPLPSSSDVPEPDAWMLMALGLPLLLVRRGRRSAARPA